MMRKTIFAGAALSLLSLPATAADLGVPPVASQAFSWTSCYAGAHVGGDFASHDITDPVQLVQDSLAGPGTTTGVTTVNISSTGFIGGGQIGCDYQFDARWVLGAAGDFAGSTLDGRSTVALPAGLAGEQATVNVKTDFLSSATVRLGYAFDRVLIYAKGGAAWTEDQYAATGIFQATPFNFTGIDIRTGFTAGAGIAWAAGGPWTVSLEYDYYQFPHANVLMSDAVNAVSGPVDTKQSIQVVKLGVDFHVWWSDQ
jgi:outer membrane immunogenic protein